MTVNKNYVQLSKATNKQIFDPKFKADALRAVDRAVEKAIRANPKLTLDAPKEKGAKGWSLVTSLVSLGPDKSNKQLEAKVEMVIATWPGKAIKAMPKGSGALAQNMSKVGKGDIEAVADGATAAAMKAAVKYLADTAP